MSRKINTSIKQLLSYTGENITRNLISASRKKMIDINESELRKVAAIVERSVEQSITNGYTNVASAINEALDEASNSSSKKKRKK